MSMSKGKTKVTVGPGCRTDCANYAPKPCDDYIAKVTKALESVEGLPENLTVDIHGCGRYRNREPSQDS